MVSFASGGAGAVLSHGTVKLLLVVWVSLGVQCDLVDGLLGNLPEVRLSWVRAKADGVHTVYNQQCGTSGDAPVDLLLDTATMSSGQLRCMLLQIKAWLVAPFEVSTHKVIVLSYATGTINLTLHLGCVYNS